MKKILSVIFILFTTISLYSQIFDKFPSHLEWKSIKTEHFWIHYPIGLERIALKMVKISEETYRDLTKKIGWEPYFRTDVILVDHTDFPNGNAMPIPHNRIEIYTVNPSPLSILNNNEDNLRAIFTHEFVHILHMDISHGITSVYKKIFGRGILAFPNAFAPVWTYEGYAVYFESEKKSFGRNNSTLTEAIVRTQVLNNDFPSIDKAGFFQRKWPRGKIPYLYGGLFVKYLNDKYGKDSYTKYVHEVGDNIIPASDHIYPFYFYNKDAKDVYKKSFPELWQDFKVHITGKYKSQIEGIQKNPVTGYSVLSMPGSNAATPRFSKNGSSIYYINSNQKKISSLNRINPERKISEEILTDVNYPNSLSIGKNRKVFISDCNYYKSYSVFNELYQYQDGKYMQLSSGLRARDIDYNEKVDKIVFVKIKGFESSIVMSNSDLSGRVTLFKSRKYQFFNTKLSPDGDRIALTVKDKKGNMDIAVVDVKSKKFFRITDDFYKDVTPAWHPYGNKIIFSSDRTGVFNLYVYNLNSGKISQLTNVLTAVISPDISPDGKKIVFVSYEKDGKAVSILDFPDKIISQRGSNKKEILFEQIDGNESGEKNIPESENYSAINSVLPTAWYPIYYSEEIYTNGYDSPTGFIIMGADTLFRHYYYSVISYYPYIQKNLDISATYVYSGLYPDISLSYINNTIFLSKDKFPYVEKLVENSIADTTFKRELEHSGIISIEFPFIKYSYQQYLGLSYKVGQYIVDYYYSGVDSVTPGSHYYSESFLARLSASYYFNNTRSNAYSISPEKGRTFLFIGDYYGEYLGSDYNYLKIRSEYSEYINSFFDNHVLMARLRGGIVIQKPDNVFPQYGLGLYKKGTSGSLDDPWGMRGFPAGSFYGDRLLTFTMEYKFPLIQPDYGFKTVPFMFNDIWVNFFGEGGNVWQVGESFLLNKMKASVGVEIHLQLTLGYAVPITGYVGYSHGFGEYGEEQIYFGVGLDFGGALSVPDKMKRTPSRF